MNKRIGKPRLPRRTTAHQLTTGQPLFPQNRPIEDIISSYAQEDVQVSYLMGLSDATGSMHGLWRSTHQMIREMLRRTSGIGEVHLRWVAFRDYCDGNQILESSGWHSEAHPVLEFVDRIQCDGGGDRPEAVERALEFAANDELVTRVVLIGDSPPHPERDYRAQAKRLAALGRPVYGFVVGQESDTMDRFKEISQITGGVAARLTKTQDLLDVIVLTVADEIGGHDAVEEYLTKYAPQLSDGSHSYARLLLTAGDQP